MRDIERVRELLPAQADPASSCGAGAALSPRAEDDLDALRRTAACVREVRPGLVTRRRILVSAAAATGAAAATVAGYQLRPAAQPRTRATAFTPAVLHYVPFAGRSAREVLLDFAGRVEKLPSETADGPYLYRKEWGWWLNTAGDVPGGVASVAVPTVTESWVKADGSGRQRSAYGDPIYPDAKQKRAAERAGLIAGKGVKNSMYGPGKFPRQPEIDAWRKVGPLSTDPARLAEQLKKVSWDGGHIINGVAAMLDYASRSGPVHPQLRAAALRVLADSRSVRVAGTTSWQGHKAIAVYQTQTWHGSTQRASVLFDPATGCPMGSEDALFGNARKLNVSVPATLAVSEILSSGHTHTIDGRP
ncbi:CU044_5270 family protein [Wenjunlia tyrosinilytica]|uniref:Uncharacterized protein n=1 Tax=Wenjunlia tyrosinilytica TaxID=1544741 RepID=A0A917ZXB0_9ACTN|nr:CU044_5270 family protein [Wenjunlia tyrosinilytica]GGO98696.1 hypothetical protein GCM10012280_63430 [Wenjunlia tyrosinilytica]